MRVNNRLEIRLTASDLKQALVDYLYRSKEWTLLIEGIFEERIDE